MNRNHSIMMQEHEAYMAREKEHVYAACTDNRLSAVSSPLQEVTNRIADATGRVLSLTDQLCAHANRLHGEEPPGVRTADDRACRSGQFGDLLDALDSLHDHIGALAYQVDRNCSLA